MLLTVSAIRDFWEFAACGGRAPRVEAPTRAARACARVFARLRVRLPAHARTQAADEAFAVEESEGGGNGRWLYVRACVRACVCVCVCQWRMKLSRLAVEEGEVEAELQGRDDARRHRHRHLIIRYQACSGLVLSLIIILTYQKWVWFYRPCYNCLNQILRYVSDKNWYMFFVFLFKSDFEICLRYELI